MRQRVADERHAAQDDVDAQDGAGDPHQRGANQRGLQDIAAESAAPGESSHRWQTIMAGMAMSLAIASVILLRNRNRTVKTLVLVAACGAGIFAATAWSLARENSGPAPTPNGRVLIQIVDEGDCVQFIHGKR